MLSLRIRQPTYIDCCQWINNISGGELVFNYKALATTININSVNLNWRKAGAATHEVT